MCTHGHLWTAAEAAYLHLLYTISIPIPSVILVALSIPANVYSIFPAFTANIVHLCHADRGVSMAICVFYQRARQRLSIVRVSLRADQLASGINFCVSYRHSCFHCSSYEILGRPQRIIGVYPLLTCPHNPIPLAFLPIVVPSIIYLVSRSHTSFLHSARPSLFWPRWTSSSQLRALRFHHHHLSCHFHLS